MDAVLGLSVTPSAVGLVLVEGQDADGATMDRDAFAIRPGRGSSPLQMSEQAAAAVLRSEAIAATRGHRLHSIGVTWSDEANTEASLLLKSLTDCGFDNVVPVRLPEATEALAWGIADVIGHEITAVCVIEPATVNVLIVHSREGAVQTAVNRAIDSEQALIRWLSAVFSRADWRPEALVVVGSGGDLDALMPRLEDVLAVPVYAPAESELALARGAALASAHNNEFTFADDVDHAGARPTRDRRLPLAQAGPLAMLVAGAVTFVASVSVAVSMEITPTKNTTPVEPRPAAKTSPEAAAAVNPVPTALPPPAAIPAPLAESPLAPPPEAPPVAVAPPPVELPVPEAPPVDGLAPAAPIEPALPEAPTVPAPGAPIELPPGAAPGLVPVQPTPVPEQRPGILRRIRDRISDIGPDDAVQGVQPAPAMAPAPGAPPPEAPAVPPPPEALPVPAPEAVAPPEAVPAPPLEAPPPELPPEAPPILPPP